MRRRTDEDEVAPLGELKEEATKLVVELGHAGIAWEWFIGWVGARTRREREREGGTRHDEEDLALGPSTGRLDGKDFCGNRERLHKMARAERGRGEVRVHACGYASESRADSGVFSEELSGVLGNRQWRQGRDEGKRGLTINV